MLTYCIWSERICKKSDELFELFLNCFISAATIPIDIFLLPLELISLLIYFIKKVSDKK